MACHRKETHAGLKMQGACVFSVCVCVCARPCVLFATWEGFPPPPSQMCRSPITCFCLSSHANLRFRFDKYHQSLCFVNQALGTDYYVVEISK